MQGKQKHTSLWWLSFADESGHLGCCIVQAVGIIDATTVAHIYGCNPGGEVQGIELPPGAPSDTAIAMYGKNRLIKKEEMDEKKDARAWV